MFEPVVTGIYLEGLCADANSVWVADPIKGGVRRCHEDGRVESWLPQKRWIGSLLRAADESVLVSGEGGITWLNTSTGRFGMLLNHVNGTNLPGVNEMITGRNGAVYFGSSDIPAIAAGRTPAPVSLYRLNPNGTTERLITGLRFSNGIGITPEGRYLVHNETFVGTSIYEVQPDGKPGPARLLLDKPDCDGLAVDEEGTIWITGFETPEIVRMKPDGTMLEPFPIPGGGATNIRFGGADRRTLYITSVPEGAAMKLKAGEMPTAEESVLYRTQVEVAGRDVPRAGILLPQA